MSEHGGGNGGGNGRRARVAKIGAFTLTMLTVAALITPKNLPQTAEYGWGMFFIVGVVAVLFLVPISLAAAELASTWPEAGGLYAWVREAFGDRLGFLAVWCEWAENIPWLPTALAYAAGALAYVFEPSLADDKVFLVVVMLVVLWSATAMNCLSTAQSSKLTSIGTLVGSIAPVLLAIGLAAVWLLEGEGSEIPFAADELVPELSIENLVLVAGVLLGFTGMEIAGFHAPDTRNPRRDFPRAMLAALVATLAFTILGSLAIAIVIPQAEIGLVNGAMQFFDEVFDRLGVEWLLRPVAVLVLIGAMAHISAWLLGPAKGLAAVARRGQLPPALGRNNARGVPATGLIVQAAASTVFSLLFLFAPGVNTSYWMLTAMTTQVFGVTYMLIFASVIRLRYTQPDRERPFRVPGGRVGVWIIMGSAIAAYVGAFCLGFFPPSQLDSFSEAEKVRYYAFMAAGFVVLVSPPFLIQVFKRQGWARMEEAD